MVTVTMEEGEEGYKEVVKEDEEEIEGEEEYEEREVEMVEK